MSEYEVGEIPPEQLEMQKKRPYLSEEDKTAAIRKGVIRLSQIKLSDWDKKVANKAAKLIARDYGETLKKLAEE